MAVPQVRRAVRRVHRPEGHPGLVRLRLDRAARGVRARRPHLGGLRRLRPQDPLPGRGDRRADPARLPHRRHHQGLGDDRPGRLPAGLLGLAGQLLPGDRDRRRQAHGAVEAVRQRGLADACGTTTGTAPGSSSTTTSSRAARTASSTSSSSTAATTPTARSPSSRSSCSTRPAGTPNCCGTCPTATSRSRTRSRSTGTPSTSRTPAGWCRAGTSPASRTARSPSGCSGSGPATTPTRRWSSTRPGCSTSASSTNAVPPGPSRSAR